MKKVSLVFAITLAAVFLAFSQTNPSHAKKSQLEYAASGSGTALYARLPGKVSPRFSSYLNSPWRLRCARSPICPRASLEDP
jgi:hypothetical protein